MPITLWDWSRYDQWCSRIINQDRINLIYNGIIVHTLHHVFDRMCHVITQIVKTKSIICSIGDISHVGFATFSRVWFVIINTVNTKTMELKDRCHPSAVSFGKIIIHSNQMNTIATQCVEVNRKRSNKCFTLTCLHFTNFTLMKDDSPNQLNVVVNHIPRDLFACCVPRIEPRCLISFELHISF